MTYNFPPKKIVVPLDGSDSSFKAAKHSIEFAKMANAEVIFIHAVVNPGYVEYQSAESFITAYIEGARQQAESWFAQVGGLATKQDVKYATDIILDVASPADSIVNYADKVNADLIVIGTKGRTGIKRVLLGSVAGGVVAHATCPVLVIR